MASAEFSSLNDELSYLKSTLPSQADLQVTQLNLTQIEISIRKYLYLAIVVDEATYPSICPSQVKLKTADLGQLKFGRQQVVQEFLKEANLTFNEIVDLNKYKCCVLRVYQRAREVLEQAEKKNFFLAETLRQLETTTGTKQTSQVIVVEPDNSNNSKQDKFKGADLIFQRLKWDTNVDTSQIVIGYMDRFLGVKEIPFGEFKGVHEDKDGVPLHRIRYFKINEIVVWDREQRTDLLTKYLFKLSLVFESRG
jgi:uncharacterized protein (UPF0248 family)